MKVNQIQTRTLIRLLSLAGWIACLVLGLWGWKLGIFTSQEKLETFIAGLGLAGGLAFTAFQVVQVVVPVLPGGLSCLAGVLLFGPMMGFVYNYVGICIGSLMAFAIARSCGKPLLQAMFPQKLLEKYQSWTQEKDRFARWFALAIFFPVAPDDFLCYLAGTTELSWRKMTAIILLGKPCSIALYSLGLTVLWKHAVGLLA